MNKSNTHLPGGTRVGSGLRTGLAGLLVSLMTLGIVQSASADVFNSSSPDPSGVNARLEKLEQELKMMKGGASPAATPGQPAVAGPGGLTLPNPPEMGSIPFPGAAPAAASSTEETEQYVILGKVNGKTLVKQGSVRFVLTDRQLASFIQSRPNLGVRRLAPADQTAQAGSAAASGKPSGVASKATASDNAALAKATGSTPPPPPPVGDASQSQGRKGRQAPDAPKAN